MSHFKNELLVTVNLVPRVFLRHTLITKPNEQRSRGRATNSLWGRDWVTVEPSTNLSLEDNVLHDKKSYVTVGWKLQPNHKKQIKTFLAIRY